MAYEKNPDELGAAWKKTSARGEYLTGNIEGIGPIVMFPVDGKGNPKAPAYRILKAKRRDEQPAPAPVQSDDINW